jgi:hypothetical protein
VFLEKSFKTFKNLLAAANRIFLLLLLFSREVIPTFFCIFPLVLDCFQDDVHGLHFAREVLELGN